MTVDEEEQRLCQSAPVPHAAQPTIRKEEGGGGGGWYDDGGRALKALLPTSLVCTTPRSEFNQNVWNKVSSDAEMEERERDREAKEPSGPCR